MATYQVKVEDLIGSVGDTAAISDFCTDTARELNFYMLKKVDMKPVK